MNEYIIPSGRLKVENATGALAIATSLTAKRVAQLISVTVKFSAAPAASEDFTVTKNAISGAVYDVELSSTDPSTSSLTEIIYQPGEPLFLEPGDAIDVAYVNTNKRTYGVLITILETA